MSSSSESYRSSLGERLPDDPLEEASKYEIKYIPIRLQSIATDSTT